MSSKQQQQQQILTVKELQNVYVITILSRNYSKWVIDDIKNPFAKPSAFPLDPLKQHMLSGDIFSFNSFGQLQIIKSPVQTAKYHAGVLVLENNLSYGTKSGTKKKWYRCIPNDDHLPIFLIPYEIKIMDFSKTIQNLFVLFTFEEWKTSQDHPIGLLQQVIGPTNQNEHFYEYQLFCKHLHISLQPFNKATTQAYQSFLIQLTSHSYFGTEINPIVIKEKEKGKETLSLQEQLKPFSNGIGLRNIISLQYPDGGWMDRTGSEWNIFTIDPLSCTDFDDALSVVPLENNKTLVSIYIANVVVWIELLSLWNSFTDRVSTIYLPNGNIKPMLPNVLSEGLCSLSEKSTKLVLIYDIVIDNETGTFESVNYINGIISISRNYEYESNELLNENQDYSLLKKITTMACQKVRFIPLIQDSHDVVAYWMTCMNNLCSHELLLQQEGIFRKTNSMEVDEIKEKEISLLPGPISNFIYLWKTHTSGSYVVVEPNKEMSEKEKQKRKETLFDDMYTKLSHRVMGLSSYCHITSPIRRLVDILNMIQIVKKIIPLSASALQFYSDWIKRIDYINTSMKSIRKVQLDCELLDVFTRNPTKTEMYSVYCIEMVQKPYKVYEYNVYIPALKLVTWIESIHLYPLYQEQKGKLYLFDNESEVKKKIRLEVLPPSS